MTPADAPRMRALDVLDRRRDRGDVVPCPRCGYPEFVVEPPIDLPAGAPPALAATWTARCPHCGRACYAVTPTIDADGEVT